jgi:stage V sporulation protein SpoVS
VRERAFRQDLALEVLVIGERAAYIAIKALGRAQGYLAQERPDLYLGFNVRSQEVDMDGTKHAGYVFALGWLAAA